MKKSVTKIIVILLVVILLPVFFYISDQLVALNKNEKIVEDVFSKQLESILYSINQHSENVIKLWSNQLSVPIESNSELMHDIAIRILENNTSVEKISFFDADNQQYISGYSLRNDPIHEFPLPDESKIDELKAFIGNNYQKIESSIHDEKLVLFFLTFHSDRFIFIRIIVDPELFIQQILRPQIQRVAQEMFYIQVNKKGINEIKYSTEGLQTDLGNLLLQELWYLPGYELGIRLKTQTLNEMVVERHRKQSYVIWGLIVVVFAAAFFLFRSIRNEIRLAEMKSEFVSNVSHEIRTPLASISMYAETLLLKRVKTEERKDEYLKTIHTETQRLSEMVNRILSFSRMEKNKRKFVFEPLDANRVIADVFKSFEGRFQKNNIVYEFQAAPELPPIWADRSAFTEVMVNLIDNAVKYGKKENPKIIVRSIHTKTEVFIEVEDNGIGISAKDKKHIFDKFYRVTKGDLALHAQGSGLGLNIVSQILKEHKAGIHVQSKPGEGSTFRLKFKIYKDEHHGKNSDS